MTFSSITFIIFFIVVYGVILLFDSKLFTVNFSDGILLKIKHIFLLISSYVFYGWWDFRFCFLMALLTLISWFCAKQIQNEHKKKLHLFFGVFFPLLILGIFKYFNFFVTSFADLLQIDSVQTLNIILPVGISFFTFQSMSYTIDVSRKKIESQSLLNVALYIAFFPQLVAGPIVKAADFFPQLETNRKLNLHDFSVGIQIFLIGLFKKLVIADNLSVFVDDVFEKPLAFSSISVVLSIISYSIQIYCDFSGYSDMAIGVARCFGYKFKPNFNIPYIAENVSEFWKRWHISLSSWLQEYLYIPLGGNRKGSRRTYINLLLTMIIGGLWHGANYTFIIWGLLHGLALCVHKIYRKNKKFRNTNTATKTFSVLLTYCYVTICWIFFRAENLQTVFEIFKCIFSFKLGIDQIYSWSIFAITVIAVAQFMAYIHSRKNNLSTVNGYYLIMDLSKTKYLIIWFSFVLFTIMFAYTKANPFIYFQF